MADQRSREEISGLLSALCDEAISAADMARLDQLLATNPQVRQAYREAIGLHAALQFSYQAPEQAAAAAPAETGPCESVAPRAPLRRMSPRLMAAVVALTAAIVLSVGTAWFSFREALHGNTVAQQREDGQSEMTTDEASDHAVEVIAHLHYSAKCHWGKESGELNCGAELRLGQQIELLEGVATVNYENGVSLVLEGPARLTLLSTRNASLTRGKCFASVPPPNAGFRLSTPTAEVIDLGTEFGVLASEKGFSEVSVFRGKVECFAMDPSGACVDRVQLAAGQTTRVGSGDALPAPGGASTVGTFARGAGQPNGVRAFWRFDEEPPQPQDDGLATQRGLIGDASGAGNRLDYWPGGKGGIGAYRCSDDVPPSRMFRKGFTAGRHSFNSGAVPAHAAGVLSSVGNHGTPEAIANGFTVEGFFKTHGDLSSGRPMTILYQGEKFYSYLVGLNKRSKGGFSFFVFGRVRQDTNRPEVSLSDKNFADGKWHYFAVRFEKASDAAHSRLRAVVVDEDGYRSEGSTTTPEGFEIACSSRPLLIGCQQYFLQEEPKARFDGLIDEIRIAGRALGDDELLGSPSR